MRTEVGRAIRTGILTGVVLAASCTPDLEDMGVGVEPEPTLTVPKPEPTPPVVDDELRALALKICDLNGDGQAEAARWSSYGNLTVCADFDEDGKLDVILATGSGKDWCVSLPEGYRLDLNGHECMQAAGWRTVEGPEN